MPIATLPKQVDVIRAWRDETYYESLSEEEKALVPENPAGKLDVKADLKPLTKAPTLCYGTPSTYGCTCIISHTHVTI